MSQSLTEMSTRNIYWGYSRPVRRSNLSTFMCRLSWNLGASNLLERSEPVQACNGIALPLQIIKFLKVHFSLNSLPFSSAAWPPISSISADLNYWWNEVSAWLVRVCVFVPEFKWLEMCFICSGQVKANSANVATRNIPATNGVIHAIDGLLWRKHLVL